MDFNEREFKLYKSKRDWDAHWWFGFLIGVLVFVVLGYSIIYLMGR